MIPGKRKSSEKFHRKPDQNNYFLYRQIFIVKTKLTASFFYLQQDSSVNKRIEELKDTKNKIAFLIITFDDLGRKMFVIVASVFQLLIKQISWRIETKIWQTIYR